MSNRKVGVLKWHARAFARRVQMSACIPMHTPEDHPKRGAVGCARCWRSLPIFLSRIKSNPHDGFLTGAIRREGPPVHHYIQGTSSALVSDWYIQVAAVSELFNACPAPATAFHSSTAHTPYALFDLTEGGLYVVHVEE